MNLKFIGRGSAFNTKESNNSAFFKSINKNMLLIDCGESIFEKIKEKNILNNVKNLFVVITHTHTDHIGSLSSLAFFVFYAKKSKINIVLTGIEKQDNLIKEFLKITGTAENKVNYVTVSRLKQAIPEILDLKFLPTEHVKEIDTYGLYIKTHDGIIYYSTDTNTDKYLKEFLTYPNLDKIYMDTSKADYEKNAHFSTKRLENAVLPNLRNKVYCMHIDSSDNIPFLKQLGFNVVDID